MRYQYVGVKEDSTHRVIFSNLKTKGRAFVLAIVSVNKLCCHSNPEGFIRIEIQDSEGNILPEYKDHEMLEIDVNNIH